MKRIYYGVGGLVLVFFVVLAIWLVRRGHADAEQLPVRAIWVSRYEYKTPEDVKCIIENLVAAGFTDLFFQVRANGTAYYESQLEPWAFELSGDRVELLGNDPGWDPLQLAIDEAAGTGLRVHAYMNVLPGWKGTKEPPVEVGQLWTAHPDWFMVDSLGEKMLPTPGWYSFVNPVLPEVRMHLKGIARELCRYRVAGIHLDYIRYPHDYKDVAHKRYPGCSNSEIRQHSDFSYDPASLAGLRARFGEDASNEEVREFRCDAVTAVVRDIVRVVRSERAGGCLVSCCVMGNPVEGKYRAYQDSGAWARRGLVDWVVQMDYATKSFDRYLQEMKKVAGKRGFSRSVVVGIYCEHDVEMLLRQIDAVNASGSRGLALFSYSCLYDEEHRLNEKGRRIIEKLRP